MSKQQQTKKPTEPVPNWEKLRDQRLANEASRKDSGTWGELTVGEIVHDESASVFVHIWKGSRRPDPVNALTARGAGMSEADWRTLLAWKGSRDPDSFRFRLVGWNLSDQEAQKVKDATIAAHHAAGTEVVNSPAA